MKVIGLTGGIGSGKSTVARFLAELGAAVLEADKIGHEAFRPGSRVWHEVVAAFGGEVLTPDGEIDRKRLGEIVFGAENRLLRLNQILHPWIYDALKARLETCRRQEVKVAVLEAAVLVEANWRSLVDEVWVSVAAEATVLKRLKQRVGLSEEAALERIRCQLPSEERVKYADVVVDTDCSLSELKKKVGELWQGVLKRGGMGNP